MYDFPFELDVFQKEACNYITEGKSVVVCAPTGAGKTVIAQHAIHCAINKGARVFYTTPLKALSNQKYRDFSDKYGTEKVGLLTGDTSCNRNAQIVVMTTEVFRNMLYGTNFGSVTDNLKDVKYIVLDEVHYMNDEQRGTVWEESIIYCPTNVQIIALSATVANADELTGWINTVHSKTELVNTDFRPVPLRFYYFDSSQPNRLLPLFEPGGALNKKIKPEKRTFKKGKLSQKSVVKDVVENLYEHNMLPAIYFTFSRKKCDEQMEKCISLSLVTAEEKKRIKEIIDEYIAENPYLYKNKHIDYLLCGVASHHAGLLPGWKVLVEKLFQEGLIKVVFATETLAAGINMPARSTVISSVSKRTDNGHRMLTPSEFLQMSGRAGRRGMDEVGYVTIIGTPFQSPEDVAHLASSAANPLESRFSPSYSMVLNLLQRFTVDEAKELVMKSFGYYSAGSRLSPLLQLKELNNLKIEECRKFECYKNLSNEDLIKYNKIKTQYVANRKVLKTIKKQEQKKKRELGEEFYEFEKTTKQLLHEMHNLPCDTCKVFKKHMKCIDTLQHYTSKQAALEKEIERKRDIFWNLFISHRNVLIDYGYLKDDYPTKNGIIISQFRSENELFLAQSVFENVYAGLSPAELSAVICAITTEDVRNVEIPFIPLSRPVKKAINKIKDIRRHLDKVQKNYMLEDVMYINTYFSALIEMWVNGAEWDSIIDLVDVGEGDLVRCFKRVIDVLRQFCTIPGIPEELVFTARDAIEHIQRSPIDIDN